MSKPTMNDYYKVEIGIKPASTDFCDLAADLLGGIGFVKTAVDEMDNWSSITFTKAATR